LQAQEKEDDRKDPEKLDGQSLIPLVLVLAEKPVDAQRYRLQILGKELIDNIVRIYLLLPGMIVPPFPSSIGRVVIVKQ
jgi:hypothetical protein